MTSFVRYPVRFSKHCYTITKYHEERGKKWIAQHVATHNCMAPHVNVHRIQFVLFFNGTYWGVIITRSECTEENACAWRIIYINKWLINEWLDRIYFTWITLIMRPERMKRVPKGRMTIVAGNAMSSLTLLIAWVRYKIERSNKRKC
jgi:arginine/lysine/ornithine decarboxylase